MKYIFLGFVIIMFGLVGVVFIVMFEAITINNESEYYVLREAMEAAMLESVDLACYRIGDINGYADINGDNILEFVDKDGDGSFDSGEEKKVSCGKNDIKIIEQKFVENFTRRFATNISGDATEYTIEFYDIIESPPKATVVIKGKTQKYALSFKDTEDSFTIINNLSGILELYN